MNQSSIKFLGLDRCFKQHKNNLVDIYTSVGLTGQVVGGSHVNDFEDNCSTLANRKYAISVANATDGLFFSMKSLGISHGDEVLTTAYSFHATAESILRTGATPVFIDVDENYHIDLTKAQHQITSNTKAIVIVNIFGNCINFDNVLKFANDHNIKIIEDAAQSISSSFNNIPSGKLGITSVYSFAPSKNIPGFSHGGCVLTDDETIYNNINALKLHGKIEGEHHILGYNSIISSFEAAQMNYFFTLLDDWQHTREKIALTYITYLKDIVKTPTTTFNSINGWHKFVIQTNNRDKLQQYLSIHNIETGIHYKTIAPEEPIFSEYNTHNYSIAKRLSQTSISLPIYPELQQPEVMYIINTIRKFFTKS